MVMGFDFIVIAPFLPSHCGFSFVFGCRVSFFAEFQCLPVDDCSAVSCDSSALTRWKVYFYTYVELLEMKLKCLRLKKITLGINGKFDIMRKCKSIVIEKNSKLNRERKRLGVKGARKFSFD